MPTFVGLASANATTVGLPAGSQAGDLAVVAAGRTNAAGPTAPGGWTALGVVSAGSGSSAHGQECGWKVLTSADVTAGNVGTWTNATEIVVAVYRPSSGHTLAGSASNHGGTGTNGTTLTLPLRSTIASGSWVVGLGTHRTQTGTTLTNAAPSGWTTRSTATTSTRVYGGDRSTTNTSNVSISGLSSSGNVGRTLEIVETTITRTGTGTLVAKGATLAASATFASPTRTAVGTLVAKGATLSGSANAGAPHPVAKVTQLSPSGVPARRYSPFSAKATTPPVYIGTGGLVAGPATLSGSGVAYAPHPVAKITQLSPGATPGRRYGLFSGRGTSSSFGTAALSAKGATLTGTATALVPVFTGTGSLVAGKATLAATATHTPPSFTGSGSLVAGPSVLLGPATHTPPSFTGSGVLSAKGAVLSGTATAHPPSFQTVGTLISKGATLAASATRTPPSFTGSGILTAKGAALAGSGLFAAVVRSAAGILITGPATLLGLATYTLPTRTASGSLAAGGSVLSGSSTFLPPVSSGFGSLTSGPSYLSASAISDPTPTVIVVGGIQSGGLATRDYLSGTFEVG